VNAELEVFGKFEIEEATSDWTRVSGLVAGNGWVVSEIGTGPIFGGRRSKIVAFTYTRHDAFAIAIALNNDRGE
jgi:hypothetical protein